MCFGILKIIVETTKGLQIHGWYYLDANSLSYEVGTLHHAVLPRQEWQDTKKYLEANPEEARRRDGKWGWKPWHGRPYLHIVCMHTLWNACMYIDIIIMMINTDNNDNNDNNDNTNHNIYIILFVWHKLYIYRRIYKVLTHSLASPRQCMPWPENCPWPLQFCPREFGYEDR